MLLLTKTSKHSLLPIESLRNKNACLDEASQGNHHKQRGGGRRRLAALTPLRAAAAPPDIKATLFGDGEKTNLQFQHFLSGGGHFWCTEFRRSALFLKRRPDKHSLERVLKDSFKVVIRETKL